MTIFLLGVRRLALDPVATIISERHLTERQRDCVRLVAKGLSSKEISRELGISPSTVDNHIAAVVIKLNLRNRHELVQMLYKNMSEGTEKITTESFFFTKDYNNTEENSLLDNQNRNFSSPIPVHLIKVKLEIKIILYFLLILLVVDIFL